MTRVAVFIDYQNTYHGARRAFPGHRTWSHHLDREHFDTDYLTR